MGVSVSLLFDGTDLIEGALTKRRPEKRRRFDRFNQQLASHSEREAEKTGHAWVTDNAPFKKKKMMKVMVTWYFQMPSGL